MQLSKTLTAGLLLLLVSSAAWADPITQLELSSNGQVVTITDNGALDWSSELGVVTFIGSVGDFAINVTTGITKPVIGDEFWPRLDLNSVNVSGAAGSIRIRFTTTDFVAPHGGFGTSAGGTADGTVLIESFVDDNNNPFGTTTSLSSLSFGAGDFSGSGTKEVSGLSGFYSLTLSATITHTGAWHISSFDAGISAPEPSSMVLMGVALAGALALRRRRKKTA